MLKMYRSDQVSLSNHISLLCDLTMSGALNVVFYLFYCNLKEKDHIRKIVKFFLCEISIIIIVGLVGPVHQKIKLCLP